ncbi:MAG: DNA primase [Phycisphaerales bacterium]|nr:DNA primase [Planctomycetota bacterium]MCH8508621.1 DNA primase [Phycisphaerales bacterium]
MSLYQNSDDDRQRVKDASDIVRVVGEHVALKPKGREFVCLCPFHDDRNPSMCVVPAKQIFHCFVCGTGGDVFSFVQKYHSMNFREALEFLAQRAGIELTKFRPERPTKPGEPSAVTKADIVRANDAAQGFFRAILNHPEHGRAARELIERRGISPEMVERFGIAAAPDRWDGLVATIEKKGMDPRPFEAAGLLKARDSGGRYDALRHRLIFPIHDQIGRVIAFGGRRIREEDDPKYLNSPETPAFRKNTTLYGLAQGGRAIQHQRTAVIVEGYTDVVACHQAGVEHVVGTLGTALTAGHATVLRRLCDTVVLLFDGDEAGQKAADRAVEVLFSEQIDIRVATLAGVTDAKDPDELFKQPDGAEVFDRAIGHARDLLAWKFDRLRASLSDVGPAAVARAVEEELDRFSRLGLGRLTPVRRQQIVRLIADATGLDERTILAQMKTGRDGPQRPGADASDHGSRRPDRVSARETVLGCLLCDGTLWTTMSTEEKDRIRTDAFASPLSRLVADAVLHAGWNGQEPALDRVLEEIDHEHELGADAAAWAVTLARGTEAQTDGRHERVRRLLEECLAAAGLEDDRGAIAEPKPGGQQSVAEQTDDLSSFIQRQRALREKYGRAGTPRLTGE